MIADSYDHGAGNDLDSLGVFSVPGEFGFFPMIRPQATVKIDSCAMPIQGARLLRFRQLGLVFHRQGGLGIPVNLRRSRFWGLRGRGIWDGAGLGRRRRSFTRRNGFGGGRKRGCASTGQHEEHPRFLTAHARAYHPVQGEQQQRAVHGGDEAE